MVFATTNILTTIWTPPKKQVFILLLLSSSKRLETKKHRHTKILPSNMKVSENKIDLLIETFSEQQSTLNKMINQKQECKDVTTDPPFLYQTPLGPPSPPLTNPPSNLSHLHLLPDQNALCFFPGIPLHTLPACCTRGQRRSHSLPLPPISPLSPPAASEQALRPC